MSKTTDAHLNGHHAPATSPLAHSAVPPWPRTHRPLKIAILGWARLSSQAWEGSGYNLSASELARGLVMSGHEVFYLQSGMTYRLKKRDPHIIPRETWAGIHCFDLRNSPNLSPSASNFINIETELSCPPQTQMVLDWLDSIGAQLVHIHSLEGFGLDLIASIRRGYASGSEKRHAPRPVFITPHNYWYLCPQVDLLHQETRVCMDYQGGKRCVGCLPSLDPVKLKRTRAIRQTIEERLGVAGAETVKRIAAGVRPTIARWKHGKLLPPRAVTPALNPDRLIDPELSLGFETVTSTNPPENDGLIRHDLPLAPGEEPRTLEPSPLDQNERFLRSDVHLKVVNDYGKRRLAGVEALNAADAILSPSNFLLKAHAAMGVMESKLKWVRLGQPHFDQINRKARRSPFYETRPWDPATATRPLRFGFFGTTRANKGLEVLLQAIPLLDKRIRQRCQFFVRALGWDWPLRKRMSLFPEVTFSGGYDIIQLISAAGDYDVGILPHIWFENSPLVMLEHLHAGKFIVASRLGGPPDWIDPPRNGLLFAGGRADELAWCITRLVTGEVRIPSPKEIHAASVLQSYPGHVADVQRLYQQVIDHHQTGAPTPVAAPHDAVTGA
jgi:glycosyltransferase involved in cell wall biosynthesis